MFLDQGERLLRTDASYAFVEVGADQEAHVDELFARDPQVREGRLAGHRLRVDLHEALLSWQFPPAANGEVLHESRGTEQEGVEVLRRGRVGGPASGHCARLGLALPRRLHSRDPEEFQQALRLIDHLARESGRLHGLRPRRREVSDFDGFPPLPLRPPFDLSAGPDRPRLEPRRLSVEDEDGLDASLDEVRQAVDESGQVRRHPTLAVHEGRAVRLPDDREELVQGVEGVDRQDLSREILEFAGFEHDDIGEVDPHRPSEGVQYSSPFRPRPRTGCTLAIAGHACPQGAQVPLGYRGIDSRTNANESLLYHIPRQYPPWQGAAYRVFG